MFKKKKKKKFFRLETLTIDSIALFSLLKELVSNISFNVSKL